MRAVVICQASSCSCALPSFCRYISSEGCNNINCTLQFKNVTRELQYTWTCSAGGMLLGTYCDFENIYAYPKPVIDASCPKGPNVIDNYILKGTNASCMCLLETPGIPYGKVQWFNALLNVTTDQAYTETGTNLYIQYKDKGNSFICKGISPVNNLNNAQFDVIYTPMFAYGPENINFRVNNSSKQLQICANETIVVQVSCGVNISDVNPSPQFRVYSENDVMSEYTQGVLNISSYILEKNVLVNKSGFYQIICSVQNSIFKEAQAMQHIVFTVNGPPVDSPVLKVEKIRNSNNNVKTVESQQEGSYIEITCQVFKGFPNTYNMTVSCDGSYNNSTTNSYVVKLYINVGRQLNGKLCVCKAEHVTSCYVNNTSSVTLNITYPAEIQQFTLNAKTSSLIISEKSAVTFFCMVESNPPATVEISKTETITTNTGRVNFTMQVMCHDSGEYTCKAHNSEFTQQVRISSVLYVQSKTDHLFSNNNQCPLQLRNLTDESQIITAKLQNNIMISIEIVGYPAPTLFTLFKSINSSTVQAFSPAFLNILDIKYHIELSNYKLPIGSVKITIHNLTATDCTNYSIKIYNGFGNELTYTFRIIEEMTSSETSTPAVLPAAVGAAIAGVVIIAIIVLIYVKRNDLKHLKINRCLRRTNTNENENYANTEPTSTSTPDQPAGRGYEEIELVQNYDKLQHTYDNLERNPNYSQISVSTVYDKVDASEVNVSFQYDSVSSQEKGNYQNVSHSNT